MERVDFLGLRFLIRVCSELGVSDAQTFINKLSDLERSGTKVSREDSNNINGKPVDNLPPQSPLTIDQIFREGSTKHSHSLFTTHLLDRQTDGTDDEEKNKKVEWGNKDVDNLLPDQF